MNLKGSLPALILQTLQDGPSHGYHIARRIKQRSKGVLDFKEGTLYPTLHGLERQGLIEAEGRNDTGRTRRYYRLTEKGHKALERERSEWRQYAQAVSGILEGA